MNPDIDRALDIYSFISAGGPDEFSQIGIIPGAPPSKKRHRHGNGRGYRTAEDVAAEAWTAHHLRGIVPEPHAGNVALGCIFFRPNRQRIDVDNMLKHVCDAAQGILWVDDSQATSVYGTVELDAANPRTVVVIGRHRSTLERGTDAVYPCAVCGAPIARAGQTNLRSTCSKVCALSARGFVGLEVPVPCAFCATPFKRTTSAQKMCSPECRRLFMRGRRQPGKPKTLCSDCGKTLSHSREPSRCRDCWKASVK